MKRRRRYTKDEILTTLDAASSYDGSIKEFCAAKGISEQNYYRWKRQYGWAFLPKAKSSQENSLLSENQRLKAIIGELFLEQQKLMSELKNRRK